MQQRIIVLRITPTQYNPNIIFLLHILHTIQYFWKWLATSWRQYKNLTNTFGSYRRHRRNDIASSKASWISPTKNKRPANDQITLERSSPMRNCSPWIVVIRTKSSFIGQRNLRKVNLLSQIIIIASRGLPQQKWPVGVIHFRFEGEREGKARSRRCYSFLLLQKSGVYRVRRISVAQRDVKVSEGGKNLLMSRSKFSFHYVTRLSPSAFNILFTFY